MRTARNRLGAALAAAALLALTACGSSDDGTKTPDAKGQPTATATADPTEDTAPSKGASPAPDTPGLTHDPKTGEVDYCANQETPFTGEAADKFGPKKVMDAYCLSVKVAMDNAFVPDMLRKDTFRAIEFSLPREYLTNTARQDYDKVVEKVIAGTAEPTDVNSLFTFMFFDLGTYKDRLRMYPAASPMPSVVNQSFSAAEAWVEADKDRLGLRFTVSGDIVMTDGKDPYTITMSKKVSFMLVQNAPKADHPWLIDGWYVETNHKEPTKRPDLAVSGSSAS